MPLTTKILSGPWAQWIWWPTKVIYAACIAVFAADITLETFDVPVGFFYVPLVCTAQFHRNPRAAWWLAITSTAMVVAGYFLPGVASDPWHSAVDCSVEIGAILVTAALIRYARGIQDRLVEQTRRAETAERIKTHVFATLSDELRNPLHSMVGMSAAVIASCRPDQRPAFELIQNSSRRLLATIENLIDLTNVNERPITTEPVDVNQMLRQAADSNLGSAAERQISVALDVAGTPLTARADPWAVRRILDNLIANAVKFSPAGGTIELLTEGEPGGVAIVVRDAGIGMSADILRRLGDPFLQDDAGARLSGTGTGLALCRRLANAMGAELAFDSEIGCGTTAILRLPA
jgi:signal transduction histidine kinase